MISIVPKIPFTLGKPLRHFTLVRKKISKKIFEIGIKSKFNFLGYYSNKLFETNKQKKTFFTNDLASMVNKNFILKGRKNEIFKSSELRFFLRILKMKF